MNVVLRSTAVNVLWSATGLRSWSAYRRALHDPARAQWERLTTYLAGNTETEVGRRYGFATIRTAEEYQSRVPISTYDELEPLIRRVAAGERAVLTQASVDRLSPSGGSTAAAKLVPVTGTLRAEFDRAVQAWIVDLVMRRPALLGGPAYWSISPPATFTSRITDAAIPVGFDHDADYLGGARGAMVRAVMAVPADVAQLADTTAFRYATVLFLLGAEQLRLISVWHPSFLEGLLEVIDRHWDRLVRDIADGTFSPPAHGGRAPGERLRSLLRPDRKRAGRIANADVSDCRTLWPGLSLVSAWGDGHSRGPADRLRRRLRGIDFQAKGLLASEGVVTIPFAGRHPLAIRSHFFEFIDGSGAARLAHQLHEGEEYVVVLTTGGGLYRYRLEDRVRVDGFCKNTPTLRFVGKEDRLSDRFGEKLSDGFVATVIESLVAHRERRPGFAMLAPERYPSGIAYTLFIEAGPWIDMELERRLEMALRENPHYAWCAELGQLLPARVVPVEAAATRAYIDVCVARGQRLGDVKPVALHPDTGWCDLLPRCVQTREAALC